MSLLQFFINKQNRKLEKKINAYDIFNRKSFTCIHYMAKASEEKSLSKLKLIKQNLFMWGKLSWQQRIKLWILGWVVVLFVCLFVFDFLLFFACISLSHSIRRSALLSLLTFLTVPTIPSFKGKCRKRRERVYT